MKKSEITIGQAIATASLTFAESVEKNELMPADVVPTHINVLIPVKRDDYSKWGGDEEVTPIIIHLGNAVKRWKQFDKSRVPANPIINQIFYQQ